MDTKKLLETKIPDNWKKYEGSTYSFIYQTIPILSSDINVSHDIEFGDDFGESVVSMADDGYFKFIKNHFAMESNLVKEKGHAPVDRLKSFRLEC